VRTLNYADHLNRYNLSKQLSFKANEFERNWIRKFTNCTVKAAWRNRWNWIVKASVAVMFLITFSKANENKNIYFLRRTTEPKAKEIASIYYNSGVSFVFTFLIWAYL
jgi:hypothetical protein